MYLADVLSKVTYSGYAFIKKCIRMCVLWELNPQPFELLTQCSTTEPQELC